MSKLIWLPLPITKVSIVEGKITVWEEMEMEQRPVSSPTGFAEKPR